jgi:hypothetical protein
MIFQLLHGTVSLPLDLLKHRTVHGINGWSFVNPSKNRLEKIVDKLIT